MDSSPEMRFGTRRERDTVLAFLSFRTLRAPPISICPSKLVHPPRSFLLFVKRGETPLFFLGRAERQTRGEIEGIDKTRGISKSIEILEYEEGE